MLINEKVKDKPVDYAVNLSPLNWEKFQEKSQASHQTFVIPFGGCGEFGMNMMGYLYQGEMIIVDCGVMFSEDFRLGTDALLVDPEWFFESFSHIHSLSYIMTHGHEDHIGGIPYFLKAKPAALYATAWTQKLILQKLERLGWHDLAENLIEVNPRDVLSLGSFPVSWIHVNHSIPMACSVWIETPSARIMHTADFKVDHHSPWEIPYDFEFLKKVSSGGCDAIVTDSTNALKPGRCGGEGSVIEPLKKQIESASGCVVVTTFSSNIHRLLSIFEICLTLGKKVGLLGTGMRKGFENAKDLDLIPEKYYPIIIEEEAFKSATRTSLVIVATGCQGEIFSGLSRLIRGEYAMFNLTSLDTIIFSSRIIPGSEKSLFNLLNACAKMQVKTITSYDEPAIHVSGHGFREDVDDVLRVVKPHVHIPVHGGHVQLVGNANTAKTEDNNLIVENGTILEVSGAGVKPAGKIDVERVFVDGFSRNLIQYETLRERLKIGESGLLLLSLACDQSKNIVSLHQEIVGLSLPEGLTDKKLNTRIERAIEDILKSVSHKSPTSEIAERIRAKIRGLCSELFRKKIIIKVVLHIV
jgi:ribonuclease J